MRENEQIFKAPPIFFNSDTMARKKKKYANREKKKNNIGNEINANWI